MCLKFCLSSTYALNLYRVSAIVLHLFFHLWRLWWLPCFIPFDFKATLKTPKCVMVWINNLHNDTLSFTCCFLRMWSYWISLNPLVCWEILWDFVRLNSEGREVLFPFICSLPQLIQSQDCSYDFKTTSGHNNKHTGNKNAIQCNIHAVFTALWKPIVFLWYSNLFLLLSVNIINRCLSTTCRNCIVSISSYKDTVTAFVFNRMNVKGFTLLYFQEQVWLINKIIDH